MRSVSVRVVNSTGVRGETSTVLPGSTSAGVPGVSSDGVPGMSLIGAPVHAVFLGDSYTYGIGASQPSNGYAYLISEALHWNVDIIGLPGSGYTRVAKRDGLTIAAGIQPAIEAQPQVLIVECGRNDADRGISVAETRRNALADLRALHAALPNTIMVVVGPVWLNGRPSAHALAVRDAVYAAQQKIPGSLWIDPIAEKWFTGRFVNRTAAETAGIGLEAQRLFESGWPRAGASPATCARCAAAASSANVAWNADNVIRTASTAADIETAAIAAVRQPRNHRANRSGFS